MIVGITGFAQVGKDTLYLQRYKQLGFRRLAFADALKEEVAHGFGVAVTEINTHKADWRNILVAWGERRRAQDMDYWIKKVAAQMDHGVDYCITDVRYANEAIWVQEQNGIVILVERPGYDAANEVERETVTDIKRMIRPLNLITNDGTKRALETAACTKVTDDWWRGKPDE